jgi:DNA-binding IclR family transcriptional regulator
MLKENWPKERPHLTVRSIEQVLRLLRDERWHEINEIAEQTRLANFKMQIIIEFLSRYRFIRLDRRSGKIRISHSLARFFR